MYIPFAGTRSSSSAKLNHQGSYAYLWSSSPVLATDPNSRDLYLSADYVDAADDIGRRAFGSPVRCFSDDYMFSSPSMIVHPNG